MIRQERPELAALVKKAVERFNNLSPEKKREYLAVQRKSWVIGETLLAHPEMSREEAERLYESVI